MFADEKIFRDNLIEEERMCSMLIASSKLHIIRGCMTSYSPLSSLTTSEKTVAPSQLDVVHRLYEMIVFCSPHIERGIEEIDCAAELSNDEYRDGSKKMKIRK